MRLTFESSLMSFLIGTETEDCPDADAMLSSGTARLVLTKKKGLPGMIGRQPPYSQRIEDGKSSDAPRADLGGAVLGGAAWVHVTHSSISTSRPATCAMLCGRKTHRNFNT